MIICVGTLHILLQSSKKLKKIGESDSFIDLFITSLNISFMVSIIGGMFGAQVYYEFFWWQVALAVVSSSFVRNMEQDFYE